MVISKFRSDTYGEKDCLWEGASCLMNVFNYENGTRTFYFQSYELILKFIYQFLIYEVPWPEKIIDSANITPYLGRVMHCL